MLTSFIKSVIGFGGQEKPGPYDLLVANVENGNVKPEDAEIYVTGALAALGLNYDQPNFKTTVDNVRALANAHFAHPTS